MESTLDGWIDVIRRQGEKSRQEQETRVEMMRAALPSALKVIPKYEDSELLDHMLEFYGDRMDPEENKIRTEFYDALRNEILKRMEK